MSHYDRPSPLTRALNRFVGRLAALGLMPSKTVTLEVRGRRSGETRSSTINWVEREGQRYFVSTRGESEWVRNVRAAAGEAVIRHRGRQQARLEEVPAEERAPIIKQYLGENVMSTRRHFGLDPKADLAQFEAIASRHPVFRIVTVG